MDFITPKMSSDLGAAGDFNTPKVSSEKKAFYLDKYFQYKYFFQFQNNTDIDKQLWKQQLFATDMG
jgi:hypothetical protein